jgi:hypothetical protein
MNFTQNSVRLNETILCLLFFSLVFFSAFQEAQASNDSDLCRQQTQKIEQELSIPHALLEAISIVESGRWDQDNKTISAWPWTINAEGEGRYFPSKESAITEIKKLQSKGIKNIDVGCMQVNLQAHPTAFQSLEQALDPNSNVRYAAQFLNNLFFATPNWSIASAHYHSQTAEFADPYRLKLLKAWRNLLKSELPIFEAQNISDKILSNKLSKETDSLEQKIAGKHFAESYRNQKIAEYFLHKSQNSSMTRLTNS